MRLITLIGFFLGVIFAPNAFAYTDMSLVANRANDLNMTINDYTFSMAIAGSLSGFLFGLFIWKLK